MIFFKKSPLSQLTCPINDWWQSFFSNPPLWTITDKHILKRNTNPLFVNTVLICSVVRYQCSRCESIFYSFSPPLRRDLRSVSGPPSEHLAALGGFVFAGIFVPGHTPPCCDPASPFGLWAGTLCSSSLIPDTRCGTAVNVCWKNDKGSLANYVQANRDE